MDNIQDIVLYPGAFFDFHNGEPISEICVRYVYDEDKFGYAYMGDYFFLDDCMYVISGDEKFKTVHNEDMPDIIKDWFGVEWGRNDEYVFRAILQVCKHLTRITAGIGFSLVTSLKQTIISLVVFVHSRL